MSEWWWKHFVSLLRDRTVVFCPEIKAVFLMNVFKLRNLKEIIFVISEKFLTSCFFILFFSWRKVFKDIGIYFFPKLKFSCFFLIQDIS
jgi:hypothetical protein